MCNGEYLIKGDSNTLIWSSDSKNCEKTKIS
jgi:hypothetical protein